MQRGSARLSAHRDDEMKHELKDLLRSGHPTRTEEWQGSEPAAEDDPQIWRGPVVPGNGERASLADVRLELARYLGRRAFPAAPGELAGALRRGQGPDALVDAVRQLPRAARYANVEQLAAALTDRL
ncbi:DUF2795 domain-containing protein [Streptomyces sp. NPDC086787]|uniref:DUF2795 domain-containing protein n=1 Tax=Streptomyces sp. NPDC086787 TaxID=3365759 RepID=UPI0037F1154F